MLPPAEVMDPLSDVLALLKPRSHMAGGEEVLDDGGADEAGRAGDENAHEILLDFAAAARSRASPWLHEIGG